MQSAVLSQDARRDGAEPHTHPIALLRVDPGLRASIPSAELEVAERIVLIPRLRLPAGAWEPADPSTNGDAPDDVLLLDGLVTREITLAGCASAQLYGPGDVLRTRSVSDALPARSRWTVSAGGATVAFLGEAFERAQRRWPGLASEVARRFADQSEEAALRTALTSLPRVEQRVLAIFWQLAERWGTVGPGGVTLHLRLTHELIGRLVGAKRPTISLALRELLDQGALTRTPVGEWRLSRDSLRGLGGGAASPLPCAPAVALRAI